MERRYEIIIDQDGIELIVTYHTGQDFKGNEVTDINHVEIVIAGTGIDILPMLNDKQYNVILNSLSIY